MASHYLILRLGKAFGDALATLQVELHGSYSLARMRTFQAYSTHTSWDRILFWCVVTPIPCLMINILLDFAPLVEPSAGRDANYVFWIRSEIFGLIISSSIFRQFGFLTPALGVTLSQAVVMSVISASICVMFAFTLNGYIPMPLPFWLLSVTPLYFITATIMVIIRFGHDLRRDVKLRDTSIRAVAVVAVQFALTFIYPIFIYGFNSISPKYQTPYMILVPVIKIIARNIMSRLIHNNDDMKPEVLIFNIDCFSAMYVSLAMQKATTISTSFVVMVIDFAQGCVSVFDIYQEFQPLKQFMDEIPVDHPLRGKNFLEVAASLDQKVDSGKLDQRSFQHSSLARQSGDALESSPNLKTKETKTKNHGNSSRFSSKVYVAPVNDVGTRDCNAGTVCERLEMSPSKERAFLVAARKLLFTIEFVTLVEYTEVIMPSFYSLLMAAMYHLPNRVFYSNLAGIGEHQLWDMVINVLMYAVLELLSLMVVNVVIRRITEVSPMRQVGFVLDNQQLMIQTKLLSWVFYSVQNSLEHLGADYSFQFKWLRSG